MITSFPNLFIISSIWPWVVPPPGIAKIGLIFPIGIVMAYPQSMKVSISIGNLPYGLRAMIISNPASLGSLAFISLVDVPHHSHAVLAPT